jgi:hypothetical protein
MSRSYEGTFAAKEHKERRDKNFCRFLPCDPCVLLRPIHSWLRLRRAARFLSANLSAAGPAQAAALAAVEGCGMENARASFLPCEPIHLNLHQIGGFHRLSAHFLSAKASAAADGPFRGKRTQLPLHEHVTHNNAVFRSSPIKANQA